MVNFEQFQLKNGVRGVFVPLPGLHSVTIEVFVKIGSKYEKCNVCGISHLLEHMAFKGTNKRPSANDIHKELDSKGASHNAGTGLEFTSYYIKTVKENIEWGLELLSDMILNPAMPEDEFLKEKGVIEEEIRMYEDNPTMGLSSEFMDLMYKNTGVGCWNIAGTVASVESIDRNDLLKYRAKYLNPKEMVVTLVGDVGSETDRRRIQEIMQQYFVSLGSNSEALPKVRLELNQNRNLTKKKEIEQAHFCLGVPTIGWRDKRRYVSRLIDVILSGNSSSRIFNEIREKRGVAYYIYTISDMLEEGGFVGVQEGVKMKKLNEAIELTKKEYLDFGRCVTEDELSRAKDYLIGKAKLNMDRTDFWSDFVGQKLLLEGKVSDLDEEIKRYRMVKLEDLKEFASEFFVENRFRLLAIRAKD